MVSCPNKVLKRKKIKLEVASFRICGNNHILTRLNHKCSTSDILKEFGNGILSYFGYTFKLKNLKIVAY